MEPAKKLEDLVVWRISSALADLIEKMIEGPRVRRYRKLRNQIRESSESVPSNLAEGFGRYYPSENAPFVRIAKASLSETQNHLLVGNRRKCWRPEDFERAWRLSCRAMKGIVPYLLYLERCEGKVPSKEESPNEKNETTNPRPRPKRRSTKRALRPSPDTNNEGPGI